MKNNQFGIGNRQIKFRAFAYNKIQNPAGRDYLNDIYLGLRGEGLLCIDTGEWEAGMNVNWCKQEAIFTQWTGLLDNFGNEVYEGDIVAVFSGEREEYEQSGICVVKFENGEFIADFCKKPTALNTRISKWINQENGDAKVIGNIFENPELAQEK